MDRLTLATLRTFCAVADNLSFTQAATRVFRTQPALSRQIAQLESDLGLLLFVREGRTLALTTAGRDLYDHARRILSDAQEFTERAHALATGKLGSMRVGATSVSLDWTVPKLLTAFKKSWPQVNVQMIEDTTAQLMGRVESRDLDLAITRFVTTDALTAERLYPMYLVAVVSTTHKWSQRKSIEAIEAADEPLLLMPPDAGSRILLEQACRQGGQPLRHIELESRTYGALVEMAQAGHGVAIVLSTVFSARPGVRAIPVRHQGKQLGEWAAMLSRRGTQLPPYATAFIKTAVKECKTGYPGEKFGRRLLPLVSAR